ncbi:MAG: polysaccharide deacetylase family protein [Cyanobacteriota bacterium]|jgi:biofilm PGA synthesis lipoprotein PgaB
MLSWLRKPVRPIFLLGAVAPLTVGAYVVAKLEPTRLDSPAPSAQSQNSSSEFTQKGLQSLQTYCQAPAGAELCPYWPPLPAPAKAPTAKPAPNFLPQWWPGIEKTAASQPSLPQTAPLTPAAFPQIHPQARLAKVPIFMYHDILPKKEVFFDVTPEELERHFQALKSAGATPISLDWLLAHLRFGVPLPKKPVLLSFDDGYGGHYQYVYPLLKKYNYPAVFSIYLKKLEGKTARSSLTWPQLKEMAADPLVTIASHTISHPRDLRELSDDQLAAEILDSRLQLEAGLGIPIPYFTYPEGKWDPRVKQWALAAGYELALAMDDSAETFAGDSPDLLTLGRFGQSRLTEIAPLAWGGYPAPVPAGEFNFVTPIEKRDYSLEGTELTLISGGRPTTLHADSRYQVSEILKDTGAAAGVDGGFFSLKYLDSNTMIGPVFSSNRGFAPGNASENPRIQNRPLVLISNQWVKFVPFDAARHNSLAGIQQMSPDGAWIKDAFVAAAWLVKDGKAQPAETFGSLFDYDANRHRAFWGINQAGQPVIGITKTMIDSVSLGRRLQRLGLREAVMLDSGASTSLSYQGESLVGYTPRPVPHVVALYPPAPRKP